MSELSTLSALQVHHGLTGGMGSILHRYTPHASACCHATKPAPVQLESPTCPGCRSKLSLTRLNPQRPIEDGDGVPTLYVTLEQVISPAQEAAILRLDLNLPQSGHDSTIRDCTKSYLFSWGSDGSLQTQRGWDRIGFTLDRETLIAELLSHCQSILSRPDTRTTEPSSKVMDRFNTRDGSLPRLAEALATNILLMLNELAQGFRVLENNVPLGAVKDMDAWNDRAQWKENTNVR